MENMETSEPKWKAFRERGWIRQLLSPRSVWAAAELSVLPVSLSCGWQVPHLYGTQGNENENLGFMASAVWICHPGQIAQILSSLLHCPTWFPTGICFAPRDGQMHNFFFHHWIYMKLIVLLMCGTSVNKNKKHGCGLFKTLHSVYCYRKLSALGYSNLVRVNNLARKCWSNLPSSLKSYTTTDPEDDWLHASGLK